MILVAIALLQATAAPPSTNDAQPAAAAQAANAAQGPKMKRVCRKVMDPRERSLASRQTVCKFVPADQGKSPQH